MYIKLLYNNLLKNRKYTLLSVIGITISVIMVFTVFNIYASFQKMKLENAYDTYGEYNVILHDVDNVTLDWIQNEINDDTIIGIEKIQGISDSGITLVSCDELSIIMNRYSLIEGEFPKTSDEIAVSATAILDGKYIINQYRVGEAITLNGREYYISGMLKDFNYSTVETYKIGVLNSSDDTCNNNVYLHFAYQEDVEKFISDIKSYMGLDSNNVFRGDKEEGILGSYNLIINEELNEVEFENGGSIGEKNIANMIAAVAFILVATSVVLGVLIFISYLQDKREQQAVLISLGFSKVYLFALYLVECLVIAFVGCIIGFLLGKLQVDLLFGYIQHHRTSDISYFSPIFTYKSYVFSFVACITSYLLGIVPILINNLNIEIVNIFAAKKTKQVRKKKTVNWERHLTSKYFCSDKYMFEKICMYTSLFIIGMGFVLLFYVKKYADYSVSPEKYDCQFELLSDDISNMSGFVDLLPEVTYFDMIYDTMGNFRFDKENINLKNIDESMFLENGCIPCEIVGVSELQYKKKIELSEEMSYEEFKNHGGAILIDNVGVDEYVLKDIPQYVDYEEKTGEGVANFEAGKLKICARSKFKNWDSQYGISIIVPEELFLKKFDYTNVLIKINVSSGYEIQVAEILNNYSYRYVYSFFDHATEYIKEHDNKKTIQACMLGAFIYIVVTNMCVIFYNNKIINERRRKDIAILRILGHGYTNIMAPILIGLIISGVVASIAALFVCRIVVSKYYPTYTQIVVLSDNKMVLACTLLFILSAQLISSVYILRKIKKQRVVYDLRDM